MPSIRPISESLPLYDDKAFSDWAGGGCVTGEQIPANGRRAPIDPAAAITIVQQSHETAARRGRHRRYRRPCERPYGSPKVRGSDGAVRPPNQPKWNPGCSGPASSGVEMFPGPALTSSGWYGSSERAMVASEAEMSPVVHCMNTCNPSSGRPARNRKSMPSVWLRLIYVA
jgi:hypothetical protein